MRYLTDRKRAQGLGSGREGTKHHWQMMVSSLLLLPAIPVFIAIAGSVIGGTYESVADCLGRPVIAIALGLSLTVIILHMMQEVNEAIEDYVHGTAGKLSLIAVKAVSYTLIVAGLFALAKFAL